MTTEGSQNPYDRPGWIACSPDKLEEAHSGILALAGELQQGNTSSLPDGLLALLRDHTKAISFNGVGEARKHLADTATQVATEDQAKKLGETLVLFVTLTNESAVASMAAENLVAADIASGYNLSAAFRKNDKQ